MTTAYIQPIVYKDSWHRQLAKAIMSVIMDVIFKPIIEVLAEVERIDNAKVTALEKALRDGSVQFSGGAFRGAINARISKEIKEFGGKFKKGAWRLPSPSLPTELQKAIHLNQVRMKALFEKVSIELDSMPSRITEIVKMMDVETIGLTELDLVSKEFKAKVRKALAVYPDLGEEGIKQYNLNYAFVDDKPIKLKLANEYKDRIKPKIVDFSFEEIKKLRTDLHNQILGGQSRKKVQTYIMDRLKIDKTRCVFIARQETALMTVGFQKVQYQSAGIQKYKWVTVGDHIVRGNRPTDRANHKILDGEIYSWDNAPSADHFSTGKQCHPGEDYNCRCQAKPIVEW